MNPETELSYILRDRADDAPTAVGLLDAVHRRSRRLAVRRQLTITGIAAVAAVATAGAVGLPFAMAGGTGGQTVGAPSAAQTTFQAPPAPSPSPSGTATALPGAVTAPVRFTTARVMVPAFPFTPGWEPPGLGPRSVGLLAGMPYFDYSSTGADAPYLAVYAGSAAPFVDATEKQQVRGHSGLWGRLPNSAAEALTWPERDGFWLTVNASNVRRADVLRFAENLNERPMPANVGITTGIVPDGMVLDTAHRGIVTYCPKGDRPVERYVGPDLTGCLSVLLQAKMPIGDRQVKQVDLAGGRTAQIRQEDRFTLMFVQLAPSRAVQVQVPAVWQVTEADLIRFAAAVDVDPDAPLGVDAPSVPR